MEKLNIFIKSLCGRFNNDRQIEEEAKAGNIVHPRARHINAVCNHKIKNLPNNFKGFFVIEESYYTIGDRTNIMPHLFLFSLNEEGNVVLNSYELPEGIKKEDFRNDNENLVMDYKKLFKSAKFTPIVYKEEDGVFKGESVSNIGPNMTMTIKETTCKDKLLVSEVMRRDGKITFGFEDPIVYERI